jgi:ribonuclease P protein component
VKRLLREAFAEESSRLPPGTDAVVVARADAWALAEREGLGGIRARLAELITQVQGDHQQVSREPQEHAGDDG